MEKKPESQPSLVKTHSKSEYHHFLEQLFGNKSDHLNILIYQLPLKRADFFNTVAAACDFIDSINTSQQNIFFGCGLTRPHIKKGRGKKEDIGAIGGFWADIDLETDTKPDCPPDIEEIKKLIYGHGIDPTHLVHSGNGVHAWWMFKEPWVFETLEDQHAAEMLNYRLQETILKRAQERGWTMDKTQDVTRVLRPPGTRNLKDPENPLPIKILAEGPQQPYSHPEIFDSYLLTEDEINFTHKIDASLKPCVQDNLVLDPKATPPHARLQDLFAIEPDFKASWSALRPDFKKQSASEYALSLATYAAMAGWSDQEIADLIIDFYRRHRTNTVFEKKPDLKKALRNDYIVRTISRARATAQQHQIDDYLENIAPVINTEYEKKLDPEGKKALASMEQILGVKIKRIRQMKSHQGSDYILELKYYSSTAGCHKNAEVDFESTSQFADLRRFKDKILEETTLAPLITKKYWEGIIKPNFTKLIVVEEVGPQDMIRKFTEWFNDYLPLTSNRTVQDATLDKLPFVHDMHWHVHPEHLTTWAFTSGLDKGTVERTRRHLQVAGCESIDRINATNPHTKSRTTVRGFYKVPQTINKPTGFRVIKGGACEHDDNSENDIDDSGLSTFREG